MRHWTFRRGSGILRPMRYEHSLSLPASVRPWAVPVLETLAVAGAVALGAWVRIPLPFTPVPVTLQTLVVLLAPFAVGSRRAAAGMVLYLALGLAGAPVFALSFGPTFGYIVGFALAAWAMGRARTVLGAIVVGQAVIYLAGTAWLAAWLHVSPQRAVALGVAPFVVGDALKALAAWWLAPRVRRFAGR